MKKTLSILSLSVLATVVSNVMAVQTKSELLNNLDSAAKVTFLDKKNLLTQPIDPKRWDLALEKLSLYVELAKSKRFSDVFTQLRRVSDSLVNALKISYNAYVYPALPKELQSTGTTDYSKIDGSKVNFDELNEVAKSLGDAKKTVNEMQVTLAEDFSVFGKSKDAKELLKALAAKLEQAIAKVELDFLNVQIQKASVFNKENLLTQPLLYAQLNHWYKIMGDVGKYVELVKSNSFSECYVSLVQDIEGVINLLIQVYAGCIKSALPANLRGAGTADYSKIDWTEVKGAELKKRVETLEGKRESLNTVKAKLKDDPIVFSKAKDAKELLNSLVLTLEFVLDKVSKDMRLIEKKRLDYLKTAQPSLLETLENIESNKQLSEKIKYEEIKKELLARLPKDRREELKKSTEDSIHRQLAVQIHPDKHPENPEMYSKIFKIFQNAWENR